METGAIVPIEVPLLGDGRRKNWAKVVTAVDDTKSDGWAYAGEFIATGGIQDVTAPCVLLVYGERGSRANPQIEAKAYVVNTDGTLSQRAAATGRAWARTLRDPVAELLDARIPSDPSRPWDPTLMGFSTEALQEELDRRRRRQDG